MTGTKRKWFLVIAIDLILILAFVTYLGLLKPVKINGIFLKTPIKIENFSLRDHFGNPFTKRQLEGHWTFLFFGFTHCEMVCPTTLAVLNQTTLILEKKLPLKTLPRVIFVSIDPERDTLLKLKKYMTAFNKNFIGVRGNEKETLAFEKQLFIKTSKTNSTITHSSDILLINPHAEVQAYFPFPQKPEQLAEDFQVILNQ